MKEQLKKMTSNETNALRDSLGSRLREVYLRSPFKPHWAEVDSIHADLFIVNNGRSYSDNG